MSPLHTHPVLVTKHRPPVFTDETLTSCEHTMGTLCVELDVDRVEFNNEADHAHLLAHYPPTPAIAALAQRLKGHTAHPVRPEYTGRSARAHTRGHL
jgi:putative transposase